MQPRCRCRPMCDSEGSVSPHLIRPCSRLDCSPAPGAEQRPQTVPPIRANVQGGATIRRVGRALGFLGLGSVSLLAAASIDRRRDLHPAGEDYARVLEEGSARRPPAAMRTRGDVPLRQPARPLPSLSKVRHDVPVHSRGRGRPGPGREGSQRQEGAVRSQQIVRVCPDGAEAASRAWGRNRRGGTRLSAARRARREDLRACHIPASRRR